MVGGLRMSCPLMWSIGNFKYVADEMMVVRNHMQQIVKKRGSILKCMCEFCLVDSKWIQPNFQVFKPYGCLWQQHGRCVCVNMSV